MEHWGSRCKHAACGVHRFRARQRYNKIMGRHSKRLSEKDQRLLELAEDSPVPEWRRPEPGPVLTQVAADHPIGREPGRCQICGAFAVLSQRWPSTLPARYVDLCTQCQKLSDEQVAEAVDPYWRRDGAVV